MLALPAEKFVALVRLPIATGRGVNECIGSMGNAFAFANNIPKVFRGLPGTININVSGLARSVIAFNFKGFHREGRTF